MPRSPQGLLTKLMLVFLCLTTACGREPIAAPVALRRIVDPNSGTRGEYTSIQEQIAALKSLLAKNGGLDQLLSRGADTALITQRRLRAESDLTGLQARLVKLEKGAVSELPVFAAVIGEVPAEEAPPCLVNLSADGCFLDWYSTIDHHGSGTVYQWASSIFHHSTATFIRDNSTDLPTKNTSGFTLEAVHSRSYSFSPSDPNCLSADHDIRETTSHEITLGIHDIGFAHGHQESSDHSQCFKKYLTVSLSPSSVAVGATANVTVGHLPAAGCAYGVTSSNSGIASVDNYGEDIWGATGMSAGTVTITASCPDGTHGSATLTVTASDECNEAGTGVALSCGPETGSPGGGSSAPQGGAPDCHWERDFIIYTDGTWEWTGPWKEICDLPEFTVPGASNQSQKLRLSLVGKGSLANGRAVTVIRSHEPAVATTIVIDTLRATAADLDQAFAAAQLLSGTPVVRGWMDGAVVSEATAAARAQHGPNSREAKYLQELRKAAEKDTKQFGKGRSLEVEIDVRVLTMKSSASGQSVVCPTAGRLSTDNYTQRGRACVTR
jgi:hypothetical protein